MALLDASAVHVLPRLSRTRGGPAPRRPRRADHLPPPMIRERARGRCGAWARRSARAFAAALRRPRARRADRDDARSRHRLADRLQPQLRARAASMVPMRSPTAKCGCRARCAREGDRLRGERVGRRRCAQPLGDEFQPSKQRLGYSVPRPQPARSGADPHLGAAGRRVRAGEQLEFLGDAVLGSGDRRPAAAHLPASRRGRAVEAARDAGARADPGGQGARARASARRCASGAARIAAAAASKASILASTLRSRARRRSIATAVSSAHARLITRHFDEDLERGGIAGAPDWKTLLQERIQARQRTVPEYRWRRRERPGARAPVHRRGLGRRTVLAVGQGTSKREAEQHAARAALEEGDG